MEKEIASLAETSKNLRRPDIKINALESANREDDATRWCWEAVAK